MDDPVVRVSKSLPMEKHFTVLPLHWLELSHLAWAYLTIAQEAM
jgi:hypothetical protein